MIEIEILLTFVFFLESTVVQCKDVISVLYVPALDNYGQSCFVRSDFLKMKCVCKTQMMPPPDHQNPVDMHTSIMCINIHIMEVCMSTGF
jgi:hypothetical protein